MTKATHSGHCQACGSLQKLPGGVMAKHGYTVRWGFFSGVCRGSGRRPFETHTDLIAEMIGVAKGQSTFLRNEAAKWSRIVTEPKAWKREYVPASGGFPSTYRWSYLDLSLNEHGRVVFTGTDGKAEHASNVVGYSVDLTSTSEVAAAMNAKYVEHLLSDAKGSDGYVKWQQARLKTWKPEPLLAVADEAPKKITTRTRGAKVLVFVGSGQERRRAEVLGTHKDGFWLSATVRFDDGSTRSVRVSQLTLAEVQ
jgi:hypothetical protein